MRKKTNAKERMEKGKGPGKLTDLKPKRVKGGEATAIKGGILDGHEKWIEL